MNRDEYDWNQSVQSARGGYGNPSWKQRQPITSYAPTYTAPKKAGGSMDLGNYELGKSAYEYKPVDPQNSKLKGLMNTDYTQLQKDLQTPGDLQINQAFDKADYTNRDIMGGNGMYGSSIYGDTINQSALNRGNALASNAANAGATVAGVKSAENQWLGNASLQENQAENSWNMNNNALDKSLIHDILMASLGNKYSLEQIGASGANNLDYASLVNNSNERAAKSGAWGSLGGAAVKGLMDNWGSVSKSIGSWF